MIFQTRGPAAVLKSVAILNIFFYVLAGVILLTAVFFIIKPALAQSEVSVEVPTVEAPAPAVVSEPLVEISPESASVSPEPPAVVAPEDRPVLVEPAPVELPLNVPESASGGSDDAPEDRPISVEAQMDAAVTAEDLGANDARILPDSIFYGFKRFGRAVGEAFTFDPVEKAELKLEHANQELADAAKLIEQKFDDKEALEAAAESLEKFQDKIIDLRESAEDLRDEQAGGDEKVGEFMTDVLDQQIKQQKMFERIESGMMDKMPPQFAERMFERIDDAREAAAENAAGMVTDVVQDADSLAKHFDAAMRNQRGSEFKDIKNLEALKRVERFVPEFAKDAIRQAQDNAFKRFGERMAKIPEGKRGGKFENYVDGINGDELRHMEIFDQLENASDLPPEIIEKIEAAKDIAARRWQEKIERVDEKFGGAEFGQRARGRYLPSFNEGEVDVGQLRVMEEIRKRVKFDDVGLNQEIEKQREKGIEKFKERFNQPDDQALADEFGRLSKQMAERPDPTTFQLISALEEKVKADPQKREFLEQMERAVKAEFMEQARKEPDRFLNRIVSNNPEDIEVFNGLKEEFRNNPEQFFAEPFEVNGFKPGAGKFIPPEFGPDEMNGFQPTSFNGFFDRAIQKQSEVITERLGEIQDPEEFEQFGKKLYGMRPEIMDTINRNSQDFRRTFERKQDFIQKVELRNWEEQTQGFMGNEPERLEEAMREKKEIFNKHIEFDPFCDESCQGNERLQVDNRLQQEFQERRMEQKPFEPGNNQPGNFEAGERMNIKEPVNNFSPNERMMKEGEPRENFERFEFDERFDDRKGTDNFEAKENFQEQPQQNGFAPKPMMQQPSPASASQNSGFKPQPANEFRPEFQINQVKEPTTAQPISNNMNGGFEQKEIFSPQPIQPMQKIEQPISFPNSEPSPTPSPSFESAPMPQPTNN
ncbi:MAG: hypothetical protein A3G00_03755 [Candidatus Magasanikbacteria bacterium RIFCSPLOWO2_12_FULL_43_12]|uniref:DUF5667 domain-containing protein n=1 Tax=Candidatus Magasanikbacteria bacterium RIFCSPLOWO2_12_FULL_43_12 TaxID=1798692 RepID=A0A1F6MVF7_9BACT|nr:MAG: hypothetical protein A3C74_00540 [Candidatus Magasanikbacteria bacterium RIFCSPHIGHO2_02_FULL_44_13]OGH72318.1 MAG: hypothetical protein A3I93_04500 [Candidatus Magasanikbacteria bacterium RIFCSPLOWO2_02_FULL_43_22]OGH75591.1 MAG: hypothetical protein A3G00_03755 [Candidatus Magasanikbacteria bacterium RIFCSPLOWO2_12_FULL_43_12]